MATGTLTIDTDAIAANWRALDRLTSCETGAVVKADGYGLGAARVARVLAGAGARRFFVAYAEEGATLRAALGPGPEIFVFSGHMQGDTDAIRDFALTPMLSSVEQLVRHVEGTPDAPFGVQLDTGMNRLGMEADEWQAVRDVALARLPVLVASHLACADDPDSPTNAAQLDTFRRMTEGVTAPLSLAATGGILLGQRYHFHLTRPGIGLYGGLPFADAAPVVRLSLPVIQVRHVALGEAVGYGDAWRAARPSLIATVAAGYADGLIRAMGRPSDASAGGAPDGAQDDAPADSPTESPAGPSPRDAPGDSSQDAAPHAPQGAPQGAPRGAAPGRARLLHGTTPCPVVGRVSMDLITVDVTDLVSELGAEPASLDILSPAQTVDTLADMAGTIGYEILTGLGPRYRRIEGPQG